MKLFSTNKGLLQFYKSVPEAGFWKTYKFITNVYGIKSSIDHIVINFKSHQQIKKYNGNLLKLGGTQTEKFGIWPNDFCEELSDFPKDLCMYFTGVNINGGLLILISSVAADDQLSRFLKDRTELGIHHIAVKTNNLEKSINLWQCKGFNKLSTPLIDENFSQLFLKNKHGQVIELIMRHNKEKCTFSCGNISGLRKSEFSTE